MFSAEEIGTFLVEFIELFLTSDNKLLKHNNEALIGSFDAINVIPFQICDVPNKL